MVSPGKRRQRGGGDVEEARHVMRLGALLADLVRDHGMYGAAAELGVSYATLHRSRTAGRMSKLLLAALERYLLEGPGASDSVWWKRAEALESRVRVLEERVRDDVDRLEQAVTALRKELGQGASELERGFARLRERLDEVHEVASQAAARHERGMRSALQTVVIEPTVMPSKEQAAPGPGLLPGVGRDDREDNAAVGSIDLMERWKHVKSMEVSARTRLERAKAMEEVLEVEMELIHGHGVSMPPGESWDPARRSWEVDKRWHALGRVRRERRRLELRRWLRRVLTLGLWWP